jgi:hypothetical protein
MFRVPYRWLPSTIIPNLKEMYLDLHYGILNVIRWIPVIWFDSWYDWTFLAKIMEYKLKYDAGMFEKYGLPTYRKDRTVRQMKICAELLRRLRKETAHDMCFNEGALWKYDENTFWKYDNKGKIIGINDDEYDHAKFRRLIKEADKLEEFYQEYLFTIMKKHLRYWWD